MYIYGNHKIMLPTDKATPLFSAWLLKGQCKIKVRSYNDTKENDCLIKNIGVNRVLTTIQLVSNCGHLVVSPDTKILTQNQSTKETAYKPVSELHERSVWIPYVLMNTGIFEGVMIRRTFTGQRGDYYSYAVQGESNVMVILKKCSAVIEMEPEHDLRSP